MTNQYGVPINVFRLMLGPLFLAETPKSATKNNTMLYYIVFFTLYNVSVLNTKLNDICTWQVFC